MWVRLDPETRTYLFCGHAYPQQEVLRHFGVRWITLDEVADMLDDVYKKVYGERMTRLMMYEYCWERYYKRGELPAMVFELFLKEKANV
jgi:hypothetical protein